jgi:hypothetical protein
MIRKRFPVLAGEIMTLPLPLLGLSQGFCPLSKHNRIGPIYLARSKYFLFDRTTLVEMGNFNSIMDKEQGDC